MSPEPPHRFRAMDVEVIAGGAGAAHAAAIEALFAERERVFSRFRPHSELALVRSPVCRAASSPTDEMRRRYSSTVG